MAYQLKLRHGKKEKLPKLAESEPAFATDTKEVFIGSANGNIQIATQKDVKLLEGGDSVLKKEIELVQSILKTKSLADHTHKEFAQKADVKHEHKEYLTSKDILDKANVGDINMLTGNINDVRLNLSLKADKIHNHNEYATKDEIERLKTEKSNIKEVDKRFAQIESKFIDLPSEQNLNDLFNDKANENHRHRIKDVVGLQDALTSGGNPFNQNLNTTDDVTFNSITLTVDNKVSRIGVVSELDFGFETSQEGDTATITVLDSAVTSTTKIHCELDITPTTDHTIEDGLIEDIKAMVTEIVDGVSYTITAYAPNGTWGKYNFNSYY